LAGDLLISRAQIGDADAAVSWLERMGGSADYKRREAAEVAALSGDAALASIIISSMPAGSHKAIAEIGEAGTTRNVVRLKKFVDQVNALGSGLILSHSQNITVAARATAERKTFGHLSYRVATRRQSFNLPNMISILLRRL